MYVTATQVYENEKTIIYFSNRKMFIIIIFVFILYICRVLVYAYILTLQVKGNEKPRSMRKTFGFSTRLSISLFMGFNYPPRNFISPRPKIPIREYHVPYKLYILYMHNTQYTYMEYLECNEIKLTFRRRSAAGAEVKAMVG